MSSTNQTQPQPHQQHQQQQMSFVSMKKPPFAASSPTAGVDYHRFDARRGVADQVNDGIFVKSPQGERNPLRLLMTMMLMMMSRVFLLTLELDPDPLSLPIRVWRLHGGAAGVRQLLLKLRRSFESCEDIDSTEIEAAIEALNNLKLEKISIEKELQVALRAFPTSSRPVVRAFPTSFH
ncbi:hypothetical protein ACFE04_031015 [Oxalis oulophora]